MRTQNDEAADRRHDGQQQDGPVEAEPVGERADERERDRVAHQMDEEQIGARTPWR